MSIQCSIFGAKKQQIDKDIAIVNDNSRVIRMTLQVVASPTIVILTTLEAPMIIILTAIDVSFMLQ